MLQKIDLPYISSRLTLPLDKAYFHRFFILSLLLPRHLSNLKLDVKEFQGFKYFCRGDLYSSLEIVDQLKNSDFKQETILDCGNSGTTMRLLMGFLASPLFAPLGSRFVLIGDDSLMRRPMDRVADLLNLMGAKINLDLGGKAPVKITTSELHGRDLKISKASAQVKSSLMLAQLGAQGKSQLTGFYKTRRATEEILSWSTDQVLIREQAQSLNLESLDKSKFMFRSQALPNLRDVSAASYWVLWGIFSKAFSGIGEMQDIVLDPYRLGFFKILQEMGAKVNWQQDSESFFSKGKVYWQSSRLKAIHLHYDADKFKQLFNFRQEWVASYIDEIPLLMVAMCLVEGESSFYGCEELKVKESDRLLSMQYNLELLGVQLKDHPKEGGFIIQGKGIDPKNYNFKKLFEGFQSFSDHRIVMAFSILCLILGQNPFLLGRDNLQLCQVSDAHFVDNLKMLLPISEGIQECQFDF